MSGSRVAFASPPGWLWRRSAERRTGQPLATVGVALPVTRFRDQPYSWLRRGWYRRVGAGLRARKSRFAALTWSARQSVAKVGAAAREQPKSRADARQAPSVVRRPCMPSSMAHPFRSHVRAERRLPASTGAKPGSLGAEHDCRCAGARTAYRIIDIQDDRQSAGLLLRSGTLKPTRTIEKIDCVQDNGFIPVVGPPMRG